MHTSLSGKIVDRIEAYLNVVRFSFSDGTIADVRLIGIGFQV
jgi:hypothetical protein